jgi:hypothetical protein
MNITTDGTTGAGTGRLRRWMGRTAGGVVVTAATVGLLVAGGVDASAAQAPAARPAAAVATASATTGTTTGTAAAHPRRQSYVGEWDGHARYLTVKANRTAHLQLRWGRTKDGKVVYALIDLKVRKARNGRSLLATVVRARQAVQPEDGGALKPYAWATGHNPTGSVVRLRFVAHDLLVGTRVSGRRVLSGTTFCGAHPARNTRYGQYPCGA